MGLREVFEQELVEDEGLEVFNLGSGFGVPRGLIGDPEILKGREVCKEVEKARENIDLFALILLQCQSTLKVALRLRQRYIQSFEGLTVHLLVILGHREAVKYHYFKLVSIFALERKMLDG